MPPAGYVLESDPCCTIWQVIVALVTLFIRKWTPKNEKDVLRNERALQIFPGWCNSQKTFIVVLPATSTSEKISSKAIHRRSSCLSR